MAEWTRRQKQENAHGDGLSTSRTREVDYPTGDGEPMAETDVHRDDMVDVIQMLKDHYADQPKVYVSGILLMFYVEGDRPSTLLPRVRCHRVSP